MTAWHRQTPQQVTEQFGIDPAQGLHPMEAARRLQQYGPNELVDKGAKSPWAILWEQLTAPLVLILIAAAVISAALGKTDSFIAIMAIVILNAILGLVQEYRAEQAMAALRRMAAPLVRVRRGGQVQTLEARELVPGDVVLLEAGNIIPADGRLIEAASLQVQEASLTGESYPVEKAVAALEEDDLPLADRRNMVYMGTSATHGRAVAIVTATGMQTELGKIADLIQSVGGEKTPLQRRMEEVGKVLLLVAVGVMILAFIVGLIAGETLREISINAVAIAVAVVPEGLPAVVTISLALGAQRMLRRRALIRKLPAVETLGSVTVICSDKTGTLTENRMTVRIVDVAGHTVDVSTFSPADFQLVLDDSFASRDAAQTLLLTAGALCNDALLERGEGTQYMAQGDPTEAALVVAAAKFGLAKSELEAAYPRIGEVPFSSERKRMTTVHSVEGKPLDNGAGKIARILGEGDARWVAFSKGAVDSLLEVCDYVWVEGQVSPLTSDLRERIDRANSNLAGEGLRVLGMAYRPLTQHSGNGKWEFVEEDMVFVGMMGIIDPPRREVKDAVATCKAAGVRPVMITGDHPLTAYSIARDLGIIEKEGRFLSGHDLARMSDDELEQQVEHVSVYARVAPEHKLRIVRALQKRGHIAAMTGDGVNDAPALKQADIGVAMGITGTDVSKQAADMVILDDNFATIVSAVEEGRTIYDNVRRFVKYLLASNTGELIVLLLSQLLAGKVLPLTTLQILWMNLITDGIPALALSTEKAEPGAMKRAPYPPNESIFGRGMGRHILLVGTLLGGTGLALGTWAHSAELEAANGNPAWNTMVFLFLTLAQMGHALGVRSHRESLFKLGLLTNPLLLGAVFLTVVVQLGAVYLPFFNDLFKTNPLTLEQLGICLALSTVVFIGVEIEKLLMRRGILR